jgi:hypothetical protein
VYRTRVGYLGYRPPKVFGEQVLLAQLSEYPLYPFNLWWKSLSLTVEDNAIYGLSSAAELLAKDIEQDSFDLVCSEFLLLLRCISLETDSPPIVKDEGEACRMALHIYAYHNLGM